MPLLILILLLLILLQIFLHSHSFTEIVQPFTPDFIKSFLHRERPGGTLIFMRRCRLWRNIFSAKQRNCSKSMEGERRCLTQEKKLLNGRRWTVHKNKSGIPVPAVNIPAGPLSLWFRPLRYGNKFLYRFQPCRIAEDAYRRLPADKVKALGVENQHMGSIDLMRCINGVDVPVEDYKRLQGWRNPDIYAAGPALAEPFIKSFLHRERLL